MFDFDKFQKENFSAYERAIDLGDSDKVEHLKNALIVSASKMSAWFNENLIA